MTNALPHNLEIEQAYLGALLAQNHIYFQTGELVDADDFYDPAHARIFAAIADKVNAHAVADPYTLRNAFADDPDLKQLGGAQYLADLLTAMVTLSGAADYAKEIHTLATRRRLIQFAQGVTALAHDPLPPTSTAGGLLNEVESQLLKFTVRGAEETAVDMRQSMHETLDVLAALTKSGGGDYVMSGIKSLDSKLRGFKPGALTVIAARPAMGKTAMGLTIAVNAAKAGRRVLFHSLEMQRTELAQRMIAMETGIPTDRQDGQMNDEDWQTVTAKSAEMQALPLAIDHAGRLNIAQIRGRALRRKRRFGIDMIIIDYLGLMAPTDPRLNRNYQIEEITTGLKALAKELNIPIILLAQLNRDLEKRDDKRPMLADLRDSGAVEQDADVVIFLYRAEYYLVRNEPRRSEKETQERFEERRERWVDELAKSRGKAEIIIAKNRKGQGGTIMAKYQSWKCLFLDDMPEGEGGA